MKVKIIAALGLAMLVSGGINIIWATILGENMLGFIGSVIAIAGVVMLTRRI